MVRCMLKAKQMSKEFWEEAVATAIYILNTYVQQKVFNRRLPKKHGVEGGPQSGTSEFLDV